MTESRRWRRRGRYAKKCGPDGLRQGNSKKPYPPITRELAKAKGEEKTMVWILIYVFLGDLARGSIDWWHYYVLTRIIETLFADLLSS